MIELCYISYPYKMSLGAMKQFKKTTGQDLWFTLLSFIEVFVSTQELPTLSRMKALHGVCDFETGSQALYALIKADPDNNSVDLKEIQDGMFKVGWKPTDREDGVSEPWPIVLANAAFDIDEYFEEIDFSKKKVDSKEQ